jgi:hydroxymethylglutaryl-CoA lyase
MTTVSIRDVAPRDGLQDQSEFIPTERKLELVRRIYETGVRWIEMTSFVSPKRVPQLADAAELCGAARAEEFPGLERSVFVATRGGVERALSAGVDEISTTVPATDAMTQANFARDRDTMLAEVLAMRADVDQPMSVTVAVAFACPFEGVVAAEDVLRLVDRLAAGGYRTILFGDTIGYGGPRGVGELFSGATERFPEITFGAHFHDARGAAVANVLTAVEAGGTLVDAALGGLGGCPFAPGAAGNVATEDVVWMLKQAGHDVGIDPRAVADAGRWLPEGLGVETRARASEATWFEWEER